jgi:predicted PurR-regulated permease PerM
MASEGAPPAHPEDAESEGDRPGITRLAPPLQGPLGVIAVSSTGLLLLAFFYTLYFGKEFFLPITLAVMLNFLLTPAVRALKRAGVPPPLGAAVILLLFLGLVGSGVYRLWDPAVEWLQRAPQTFAQLDRALSALREPVEAIRAAGEQVEALARGGDEPSPVAEGESSSPQLGDVILDNLRRLVSGGIVAIFLLYFLLALDDLFLRKFAGVLPMMSQRRKAVLIVRATERDISRYVLVRTVTNAGLGITVGLAMWLLGMPNPVLWGVLAGVLNYIPYLGGFVTTVIVGLVALTTFDSLGRALLVPLVYAVIDNIEGHLVTPMILGRELTLNPVMIFTWLIFWAWIWGIPGALLAIPLLATTKIIADNIKVLAPLGAFLGR